MNTGFKILGDVIIFDGERVGEIQLPHGTLRDRVEGALTCWHEESYSAGRVHGFNEGYEEGDV